MNLLRPPLLALSLLTTLPVGRWLPAHIEAADQGRSVACYPLVGLIIGIVLVIAQALVGGAPPLLAAALLLLVWVGLTGALHLDGLADCADAGFASHRDATRTLTVMKDPAAGPVAVVTLVIVLLARFAALAALFSQNVSFVGVLLVVPMFGRSAAAALMATTRYQSANGIARDQAAMQPRGAIVLALIVTVLVAALVVPTAVWVWMLLVAAAVFWGWRRFWQDRVGGYTGDVAGGLIALVETAVLIVAVWSGPWS